MLFQVQISVLNSDSFVPIKVRHANRALKADVVFVHVDRYHYIPLGKIHFNSSYHALYFNTLQSMLVALRLI